MKTVAEFTIREVEEDGMCRVQYIAGDTIIEGKSFPHNQWGHPYYFDMVAVSLQYIIPKAETGESKGGRL